MFAFRFMRTRPAAVDLERYKRDGREKLATTIATLYQNESAFRDHFGYIKK